MVGVATQPGMTHPVCIVMKVSMKPPLNRFILSNVTVVPPWVRQSSQPNLVSSYVLTTHLSASFINHPIHVVFSTRQLQEWSWIPATRVETLSKAWFPNTWVLSQWEYIVSRSQISTQVCPSRACSIDDYLVHIHWYTPRAQLDFGRDLKGVAEVWSG